VLRELTQQTIGSYMQHDKNSLYTGVTVENHTSNQIKSNLLMQKSQLVTNNANKRRVVNPAVIWCLCYCFLFQTDRGANGIAALEKNFQREINLSLSSV